MVAVANVENLVPRDASKREAALTRPTMATWTRSSSGSLGLRNRRASERANDMWLVIRSGGTTPAAPGWIAAARSLWRSMAGVHLLSVPRHCETSVPMSCGGSEAAHEPDLYG